jgi:PAS domain S-box-containing protein
MENYVGVSHMGGVTEEDRKKLLKEVIRQLHAGVSPQEVKEKFKQVLEGVSSLEIAKIEQELIGEGISREEIQQLCNLHLAIFREQLEKQKVEVAPENPVSILRGEHDALQKLLEKLSSLVDNIQKAGDINSIRSKIQELGQVSEDFLDAEKHYLREENVLFPMLEKHGITEPPAIMWMEHNQLREMKKQLQNLIRNYEKIDFQAFKNQLVNVADSLNNILSSHIFKENSILFPAALRVITEQEWLNVRREFDEIGYSCFTPAHLITKPEVALVQKHKAEEFISPENVLQFETGALTKDEVEAVLNTLPVDITFVDEDDAVKYFSKGEKRIFTRTKAIIGRKVQLCHPQKSIHIVNRILEAFKKGEKNVAEFWIKKGERLIHIRYFAVRDKNGKYLGTMEVTQDITELKKVEGEKRLLEWEG